MTQKQRRKPSLPAGYPVKGEFRGWVNEQIAELCSKQVAFRHIAEQRARRLNSPAHKKAVEQRERRRQRMLRSGIPQV